MTERLEWLPLSHPPSPVTKKVTPAGASPCPQCGWPVAPETGTCAHCGYTPVGEAVIDLLGRLNIQLLPRLVEVTPAPERWFKDSVLDAPLLYDLRLQAERLRVTGGFDRLICLDDISVDHYEYQLDAALRALRDMRGRALLADEVGLGKTIEAGIVMKELIERGLVNSVLIIVPASLTWQWYEEMQTKFHEEFVVLEDLNQLPLSQNPTKNSETTLPQSPSMRWLISLDRAKADRWAERLLAREYDLLIVDEAHKLKNHQTDAYRFVNQIRKRYVLMLTATPVHNDLIELYNLVTILRPGHLGTRRAFRRNFVTTTVIQAEVEPVGEPSPPPPPRRPNRRTIYGGSSGSYGIIAPPAVVELAATGGVPLSIATEPAAEVPKESILYVSPQTYLRASKEARQRACEQGTSVVCWIWKRTEDLHELETHIYYLDSQGQEDVKEVQQLIAQGYEVVDFEAVIWFEAKWSWGKWRKRRLRLAFVCRLKLKPQPRQPQPTRPRLERRTTPNNPLALRGVLQEIMIRHRRSSVGVLFPPRQAAVYHLNLTPPERELYDGVTAYIREQLHREAEAKKGERGRRPSGGAVRMTLMTLQKALCSSPQAVAQTLGKLVAGQADPRLAHYLALAQSIEIGRKVDATQIILSQYPGKFLIFTDYLPTLHALRAALVQSGHETVVFHGGMSTAERVEAVRTFRKSPTARVMISTQSGGEGHNLQFCHQIINYDLPWNPMRIEQRIGRVHRLGQQRQVNIFNLSTTHTIEAYVLDLLARKIRMFELVIGELDLVLGELGDERSFEDYIEEAWADSKSETELLQMMAELEVVLGQAQQTYEQIRSTSDELSDLIDAYDEIIH